MSETPNAVAEDTSRGDDDLASLLAKREHARPNKVTWVLLTLAVLMVGFAGGALANQKFGASTSSPSFGGFPAGFTPPGLSSTSGGAGAAAGFPGAGGGFGGLTVGTVKLVDGTNVYVATNDGATVKVKVPASATLTAQKDIELTDLSAGTTVMVRGETASDGTVTATSVSETSLPVGGQPGANATAPSAQASPQPTKQGAN
jgi:hypothetical protein